MSKQGNEIVTVIIVEVVDIAHAVAGAHPKLLTQAFIDAEGTIYVSGSAAGPRLKTLSFA